MSTNTHSKTTFEMEDRVAGFERSEPVGRVKLDGGDARESAAHPALPGLPGGGLIDRPELSDELIDELLGGARTAQQIAGPDGLLGHLTRRLLERALEAEIAEHVGYERGHAPPGGTGNARNGRPAKTVLTDQGPVRIRSPRDRAGTFEPQIVAKRQTRWVGFDDRVVALYARGLTVRDIQAHLEEIYGTHVSPDLISQISDAVLDDVKAWQTRPLDAVYAIVYLDALIVKIRDGNSVRNHACYLAIGVNLDGERDVLGIWFQKTEGAKFWLAVLTDLKQRGVADILICCVDGLTGFPDAIEAVFPQTEVQTCIVHLVRSSLRFVPYKDRKRVAADLRKIYTAVDADHAADELTAFAETWDERFPTISRSWLEHWEHVTPFLAFPPDVRRIVYTTNTIEALNRQIRKIIKTRGHFPTEDAARKLIYLAIDRAERKWRRAYNWNAALAAFKIHFGDRVPDSAI
jgi:transposase-like protein